MLGRPNFYLALTGLIFSYLLGSFFMKVFSSRAHTHFLFGFWSQGLYNSEAGVLSVSPPITYNCFESLAYHILLRHLIFFLIVLYVAEMSRFSIISYLIIDQNKSKHSHFIPVQITDLQKNSHLAVSLRAVKQSRKLLGEMPYM